VREPEVVPDLGTRVAQFQRPVLTGVGLILAFVVAILALRPLREGRGAGPPAAQLTAGGAAVDAAPAVGTSGSQPPIPVPKQVKPSFVFPEANTEIRDRVVSTVTNNPDAAARLVKIWIKDP
jgi:flagellar biosynthesis/type III secretory pathway M-ring protein FliF/YscJ